MTSDNNTHENKASDAQNAVQPKKLTNEAAQRALDEAELRRKNMDYSVQTKQKEVNGSKGPEPTRYGDWEKKGIASDF